MLKRILLPIAAAGIALGIFAGPSAAKKPDCPPGVAPSANCKAPEPTPNPNPLPNPGIEKFPAKLQVFRATVTSRKLDVLASLTSRASGSVAVTYVSNGTTTKFSVNIDPATRNLKFTKKPSAKASKLRSGIITFIYNVDNDTFADNVRVRAANRLALLKREVAKLDKSGNLAVSGTVSPLARGVVRIRLDYPFSSTSTTTSLFYNVKITNGTWQLKQKLPAQARKVGGELSIQFTGYNPAGMRGEQDAKQVLPGN
ncbi:MAG: hypothetical protein ACR2LK_06835 [Solirubrobacteraceae bacterium]